MMRRVGRRRVRTASTATVHSGIVPMDMTMKLEAVSFAAIVVNPLPSVHSRTPDPMATRARRARVRGARVGAAGSGRRAARVRRCRARTRITHRTVAAMLRSSWSCSGVRASSPTMTRTAR